MGIWEAMEMLNTLVDESDPDVSGFLYPICGITKPSLVHDTDKCVSDRAPFADC
jgi:hypothetical protein